MNYGMYISAAGAMVGMHRLDVASNNLANVNTTAFKPDAVVTTGRLPERLENGPLSLPSDFLMERIGGGVLSAPTVTKLAPAAADATGRPMDIAIVSEGFFVVRDVAQQHQGDDGLRLTRDGGFLTDSRSRLVNRAGLPVLDATGNEISIPANKTISFRNDGAVLADGQEFASLWVAGVDDPAAIHKAGENLFAVKSDSVQALRHVEEPRVQAGALERSAVDPVMAMLAVQKASGATRNNLRMIQLHDELMNTAINRFARIA